MLQRRKLDGGVTALVSADLQARGFLVAFTERSGGASEGPFRSLNLGLRSGDDAALVVANRRMVCRALGLPGFATGQQVHGPVCEEVKEAGRAAGFEDAEGALPGADALVTSEPGLPIAVMVADCVPVALADPGTGRIAVVHAGWRGVASGVVGEALKRFGRSRRVRAVIGPAIGPDHYEVGNEVAAAVGAATGAGAVGRRAGSRVLLDLPATVEGILREHGVEAIDRESTCTACRPDRFYSHRRDGATGRQALIACRL